MDSVLQETPKYPYTFSSYGSVQTIGIFGDDLAISEAARISINRGPKEPEKLAKFILSLAKQGHWKAFEFANVKLKIKCPIFVARQWRTHNGSYLELSRRYSAENFEFYVPRAGKLSETEDFIVRKSLSTSMAMYNQLVWQGNVKKEIARIVLPVALYTTFIWETNVRDLIFFLQQRLSCHAQEEIQEYANDVYTHVLIKYFPYAAEAFDKAIKKE